MHETPDDLAWLQAVLDDSHAGGGSHLRSIFTDDLRIDATELCDLLLGVQILALATVTSAGEPRVAPVDGLFFRGRFHFGTSPDAFRLRHLRNKPAVSAAHIRGEELAVIVHGTAELLDLDPPDHQGFRHCLVETYSATHGPGWEEWGAGNPYAVIHPARMYASRLPKPT